MFIFRRNYGEYFDTAIGLYYLRARYYDPTVGRFTQEDIHWNTANMIYGDNPQKINEREDALGLKTYSYAPQISAIVQSGNLYVYGVNNPIRHVDSSGKFAKELQQKTIFDGAGGGGSASMDIFIIVGTGLALITSTLISSLSKATVFRYRKNTEFHHIVAKNARLAKPAADILNSLLSNGVNSEENIVEISTSVHRRLHTNVYYGTVNLIILSAYFSAGPSKEKQTANVLEALSYLRSFIKTLDNLAPPW